MTQQEIDLMEFSKSFLLSEELRQKTFCITGGTGLIGSSLTKGLLALNVDVKVTLPVRNREKAQEVYGNDISKVTIVECQDLEEWTAFIDKRFDFIIHCASPTAGKFMEEHPLETYNLAYQTTFNLLKLSLKYKETNLVYISSLEYYGQMMDDRLVTEDAQGYIDAQSARSSYPMGKRAAEYLCFSFAKEYGVHARVARLTQVFGAGVSATDNRVFAQFARSIVSGEDIVLHTKGESAKPYCYTTDCVSAILYILLRGKDGNAYNVANDDTYISIKEMAEYLRNNFNPNIRMRIELNDSMGYAPVTKLRLSSEKLRALGWKPLYGLKVMFEKLLKHMSDKS